MLFMRILKSRDSVLTSLIWAFPAFDVLSLGMSNIVGTPGARRSNYANIGVRKFLVVVKF
jgi:hypothetical protein